jgi:hypothetical protein
MQTVTARQTCLVIPSIKSYVNIITLYARNDPLLYQLDSSVQQNSITIPHTHYYESPKCNTDHLAVLQKLLGLNCMSILKSAVLSTLQRPGEKRNEDGGPVHWRTFRAMRSWHFWAGQVLTTWQSDGGQTLIWMQTVGHLCPACREEQGNFVSSFTGDSNGWRYECKTGTQEAGSGWLH